MAELQRKPEEVKAWLDLGEKLISCGVGEHREYEVCRIEGAKHVPLGGLAARVPTLPVVEEVMPPRHAQPGRRGRLRVQGFEKAESLAGGIERWSVEVDPKVPRYGNS